MLRSKLVNSLLQIVTQSSLPGVLRSTRLKRKQRSCGTEQLEVRQMLTGDFAWVNAVGSTGEEVAKAVTTDVAGNVYTAGHFNGTVDFDPGSSAMLLTSAGTDIFVTKVDSNGTLVWARSMGGTAFDDAYAIAVDALGNVYTTGYFSGTADFNPGPAVINRTSVGSEDMFVSKLDSGGNFGWVRSFGGGNFERATGIAVDSEGNVYTTGLFEGTADFDPGAAVENQMSAGSSDIFVSKLDVAGNFVWAKRMGGTSADSANDIAVDSTGNVYTTGYFSGTADFDPNAPSVFRMSAGDLDIFVSKLDSTGTFVWVSSMGGTAEDRANGIAVDSAGNVYTTGYFYEAADFDPSGLVAQRQSAGGADIFVSKLDNTGDFVWARSMGGLGFGAGNGIAVDSAGNVYTTGDFTGTVDFDPSSAVVSRMSAGENDIYVSKLDKSGNFLWASSMGGTGYDNANDIAVDSAGYVYATGYFEGSASFDPGNPAANRTSAGLYDAYTLQLSPDMLHTLTDGLSGDLLLRRNGAMLELWFKGSFTFGKYVLFDAHPISLIRSVRIKGSNAANNSLTLDFAAGGSFSVDQGIQFTAGTNAGDSVQVLGVGNEGVAYRPSSEAGSGKFVVYGKEVAFTGVEYTAVTTVQALSVEPQGSADVLTVGAPISLGGPITSDISGTTGGGAIVPILFKNVRDLSIDTGVSDAALAQSNDTVTFNAGSYETQGLKNVFVRTGKGNDTLRVNSADLGLPESGGSFWYLGGAGSDLLQTTGDANWDLNETRLASSGGGRLQFDETERVSITGGVSNNHINASQFTGAVILDGAGGNDLLRGGAGSDTLFGGNGNDRLFGGAGDDVLHGQDGNDSVWGDDGLDTLNGNAGNDLLWGGNDDDVVSGHTGNDVMMGGSGRDTLNAGEHNDRLYGEAGDDVLFGGTGNDQLWGGDDDDLISSEDGDDELWGGNGNDQLDGGGGSDQVFGDAGRDILNGGSDMDLLDGGSGSDRLNGDGGIDLYVLQGTENTEELWLNFVSANSALFRRRPRGLVSTLELDTITMDASDEFQILALGGDDNLLVDALFTQLGQLDGGAGDDLSGAPAGWTKISC